MILFMKPFEERTPISLKDEDVRLDAEYVVANQAFLTSTQADYFHNATGILFCVGEAWRVKFLHTKSTSFENPGFVIIRQKEGEISACLTLTNFVCIFS